MPSTIPTVLASVLISIVAGAGVAFVALPAVYPSLQANQTNTPDIDTDVDKGVTQTVLTTWKDYAYITDDHLTWDHMNQTQVNFTISSNSKILLQFTAPYLLFTDNTFSGGSSYEVALVIENVGNSTTLIHSYSDSPSGYYHEQTYFPILTFMSGSLSAGTYNCTVLWRSLVNATGYNSLSVGHSTNFDYERQMLLEEIVV